MAPTHTANDTLYPAYSPLERSSKRSKGVLQARIAACGHRMRWAPVAPPRTCSCRCHNGSKGSGWFGAGKDGKSVGGDDRDPT